VSNVRKATLNDLAEIAAIHAQCIPYSINSIIGLEHLKNLYTTLCLSPSHDLLVAEDNGSIVGFISGTTNYALLVKGAKGLISIRQVLMLVPNMGLLKLCKMILDRIIFDLKFRRITDFYYFSTWGVKASSTPLIAPLLFRELIKRANSSQKNKYVANVNFESTKLIRMYNSLGFQAISRSMTETILVLQVKR
jgi:hypothetical protein